MNLSNLLAADSGWETESLGLRLVTRKGKKPILSPEPGPGRIPYIDIATFESGVARQFAEIGSAKLARKDDLLMVWDGARSGLVGRAPFDGAVGSTLTLLKHPAASRDFLFHFLRTQYRHINSNPRGSGIPHVNPEILADLQIPIVPLELQRSVVETVESLESAMAVPRERLATIPALLKKFRQSVLATACSGQLTADWRGTEDAPLWKSVTLSDVSTSVLGKMLDKGKNKGAPKPYLRNINVRWWGFDLLDLQTMPFEDKESERYGLRRGDVLICEGGEPGRCAVWDQDDSDIRFQKAIHRVRCSSELNPFFLAITIRHLAWWGSLVNYFTGSGIAHLTGKSLATVEFDLPPIEEQAEIVRRVESLFALADSIESRLAEATDQVERTTQAILAKAFRGELVHSSQSDGKE